MSKLRNVFSVYFVIGLMIFGLGAQADGQNQRSEREVRDILRSLNSKVDDFRYELDNEFRRAAVNRNEQNEIRNNLRDLENNISQFEGKLQRRRESADDVSRILDAAKNINDFVLRQQFSRKSEGDWANVRGLLDRLASNYNVSWDWDDGNTNYPNDNPSANTNSYSSALTGTYQLDVSRSENTREIADRAIRNSNSQNNDNARQDLENKLEAPEQIAIDVRGNQVTLASSRASQITFTADGREKTETLDNGKTVRVRARLRGQELTISSLGGDTDYTIVFNSADGGKSMRVTRRITTDYLRQTVFAESVYNKTDSVARLNNNKNTDGTYSSNNPNDNLSNDPNYPTTTTGRRGDFIVANGTILTGILENDIDTKVSQNNDRFRMTVNAPNEYRGAVIEGYLTGIDRSGRVSGRSQITFNFERIRLTNGQTYDFAGFLQSITDENGKTVKVDTEGTAKGDSQTKETIKRGGIGAGIGAIIGAIAGGGKGAAIGAVIGGGAGAGSVIVQGKDDLQLKAGSTITVQSSSPIR
ncbi:MAG: hypothetical protein M3Q33_04615 [Acidobacteriota bacterium]|nr:hypothetical protein [Acidobacteriota bacterium]